MAGFHVDSVPKMNNHLAQWRDRGKWIWSECTVANVGLPVGALAMLAQWVQIYDLRKSQAESDLKQDRLTAELLRLGESVAKEHRLQFAPHPTVVGPLGQVPIEGLNAF